jgi:drug/metabolite transporter (DMT)-like permease
MKLSEWCLLGFLSLLWGGSFFFSKVALSELPPLTVVLARVGIASGALWVYLRWRGIGIPIAAGAWGAFFGMGLLNSLIPFTLIFWGLGFIDSGFASILIATTPVFSIVVGSLLGRDERVSVSQAAGVVLGIAGVAVLLGGQAVSGAGDALWGILACLGAALSYGFANVFGRRFKQMGIEPAVGAFGQIAATSVMALPLALLIDQPWHLPAPGAVVWGALIGLALLSTAVGYVVFFRLIATAGATNTSLVTLLVPVSAVLLGAVFLGEQVSAPQLGGMALIAVGLVVLDGRILQGRAKNL